ncbi:Uncharacterized protein TCM_015387 [Theobroma cacao]|uniref:RNase H type-1 domain-containing protein n=1 Tax=Theobroma cacao TaxID=3641 RepID=A0A061G1R6_THECC|nr:Uncharacterized protein TCM_015387 [Theobroma cacao]
MFKGVHKRDTNQLKRKCPEFPKNIQSMCLCVLLNIIFRIHMKTLLFTNIWTTPSTGWFKLNTDGAARDCPGMLGIGGVLRDNSGAVKIIFSEARGRGMPVLLRFLTIREALVGVTGWGLLLKAILKTQSIGS